MGRANGWCEGDIGGNFGKDPVSRTLQGGKVVTNASIGSTYYIGGATHTEWTDVVFWDKNAEFVAKYATKGDFLAASGVWKTNAWVGKDGLNHTRKQLHIIRIKMMTKKKEKFEGYDDFQDDSFGGEGEEG